MSRVRNTQEKPSHPWISSPHPDYLGSTWQARTIFLTTDDGGAPAGRPDVAVIVHESDAADLISTSHTAALYLPGFQDTFFHTEQAAAWRSVGVPLVGLDFRRGGRALRLEASRDDIRDLGVREEEISTALGYLRNLGARRIILIGHSTGGLQAALWASHHPGSIDALILNSPWLDQGGSQFVRTVLTKTLDHIGKYAPRLKIARLLPSYARSLHRDFGGEFYFNPVHKVLYPAPVYAGFFRTVRHAHAEIARANVRISCPVLVAHSSHSGNFRHPSSDELASSDVVLNVEDMKRLAPLLSENVELLEIPHGRHDLALSRKPSREIYTRETVTWAMRHIRECEKLRENPEIS